MPIFDQGYQHWEGTLSGHAWRWLPIARRGVKAQFKGLLNRIFLLMAITPALALGAFLALWGLVEQKAEEFRWLLGFLPKELTDSPALYRVPVWTLAYYLFLQIETFVAVILVLIVGPNLISQDMRFNAMPLYLSRPLTRFDYFAGKLGTIGAFLGFVMIVPSILAYLVGVAFSLNLSVVADTYRILLASVAYGLIVVVVFGLFMLAISSLSKNTRNVAAIWIGIWLVGWVSASIITVPMDLNWGPTVLFTHDVERIGEVLLDTDAAWKPVAEAQAKAFAKMVGPFGPPQPPMPNPFSQKFPWPWAAYVLVGLVTTSLWILTSRVKSLDRLR